MTEYIKCPFCNEDDFDLIGLKHHIRMGYCEVFNNIPEIGSILEEYYDSKETDEK